MHSVLMPASTAVCWALASQTEGQGPLSVFSSQVAHTVLGNFSRSFYFHPGPQRSHAHRPHPPPAPGPCVGHRVPSHPSASRQSGDASLQTRSPLRISDGVAGSQPEGAGSPCHPAARGPGSPGRTARGPACHSSATSQQGPGAPQWHRARHGGPPCLPCAPCPLLGMDGGHPRTPPRHTLPRS